ncbi:MAG: hypothetical protein Q9171_002668 [Xanthocarpia ochracea]
MSASHAQDGRPPDGSAQQACETGSSNFENALRGMILGHGSQQPIRSETSMPKSCHQLQAPTLDINAAPTPDLHHTPSSRDARDPARSNGEPQGRRPKSTTQKPHPMGNDDAAALLATPGDAPVPYTIRQAKKPRRGQTTGVPQASATLSVSPALHAEPSLGGTSHETPRSEPQPTSRLRWTPPAAFNGHVRPFNQPQVTRGSQQGTLQRPWLGKIQQGDQRVVPPASSYDRPPPQHQRLYDPHADSQQSYHHSGKRGQNFSTLGLSQPHHLTMQAQINYLDSTAQLQIPKAIISSEEEEEKEALRGILEDVCQRAITEYEVMKEPLFDGSTVSLRCFGSLRTGFATRSSDMDLALGSPQSIPDVALPESEIPRVLEKALLNLGYGARLLTRTRVPIIRFCEKPTPDLAARLQDERLKWERERDASLKSRKSKGSRYPKDSIKKKKSRSAEGKQCKGKPSAADPTGKQQESEAQSSIASSSEQTMDKYDSSMNQSAAEHALAEKAAKKEVPPKDVLAEARVATPGKQNHSIENPAGHVGYASTCANGSVHSETESGCRETNATNGTNAIDGAATGLRQLSLADGSKPPEGEPSQVSEAQVLPSGKGETTNGSETVAEAAEPQLRLESTLPDEEIVRLYRLAMKEGWFEHDERSIIFAFIKAYEDNKSVDQLAAYRSQLLALPDVLSRYRPPPDHRLDFPKDGVGVQCDINFSNRLALHNSHLLRCYNLSDPRVRPMVLFVKAWAKRRNINSPYHGTLSSYGYVLMVLHYLINVMKPPICLNLQTVEMAQRDNSAENTQIVDGYNVRFWRDEKAIQQWAKNSRITSDHYSSVGSLLRGFYQYFAVVSGGFSWGTDVLSLRTPGGILSKQQKDWMAAKTVVLEPVGEAQKGQEVRQRYLFAIEDPFEINHNIARTVVHNGIVAIRDEFRRANRLIHEAGNGRITEDLFEEAEAKDDLNHRHFGPRPRPRPPQQTKPAVPAQKTTNNDEKQPTDHKAEECPIVPQL